jgi:hypothetical protein
VLYKKNIQFTRLIKINGQLKEFNFRKPTPEGKIYNVDVGDERGNRHIWAMEPDNGTWKIKSGLLPTWIVDSESLLDHVIQEEEARMGVI